MNGDRMWYLALLFVAIVFVFGLCLPPDKPKRRTRVRARLVKPYTY